MYQIHGKKPDKAQTESTLNAPYGFTILSKSFNISTDTIMDTNAYPNDFFLTDDEVRDFCAFTDAHDTFLIVGHKEPDGDCICSCLALRELLTLKGKKALLLSAGPFPFKREEIKKFEGFFAPSIESALKKTGEEGTSCEEGTNGDDFVNGGFCAHNGDAARIPDASCSGAVCTDGAARPCADACTKSAVDASDASCVSDASVRNAAANDDASDTSCVSEASRCALIMADCSTFDRIGEVGIKDGMFDTFIIDHHKTACAHGKNRIIKPLAPAACYAVQLLFEAVHGEVTAAIAPVLFLGLSTDSGFFRFLECDSAPVFAAASRLIQKGASPKETYAEITGHKPFSTRKLLAKQLSHAELFYGGKLIATYQTIRDNELYGEHGKDSDSLYQLLLSVEGVEAVISIKEETPTQCTVGLRSKTDVDVSGIAARFGGGGHKNASGLSVDGTAEEVLPKLVSAFADAFAPLTP